MKLPLPLLLLPFLAFSGCTDQAVHRPAPPAAANRSPLHPPGTDVGTSFPGVNQPASPTTATSSSDSR